MYFVTGKACMRLAVLRALLEH